MIILLSSSVFVSDSVSELVPVVSSVTFLFVFPVELLQATSVATKVNANNNLNSNENREEDSLKDGVKNLLKGFF